MESSPPPPVSPTEWIRIFASRVAQCRPDVCAAEVLALSIDQFKRCHSLPPEVAAANLTAADGAEKLPDGR